MVAAAAAVRRVHYAHASPTKTEMLKRTHYYQEQKRLQFRAFSSHSMRKYLQEVNGGVHTRTSVHDIGDRLNTQLF